MYGMDPGAFPQKNSVMSHPASGGSRGRILDQESLLNNRPPRLNAQINVMKKSGQFNVGPHSVNQ
jgi:hypothetical protein